MLSNIDRAKQFLPFDALTGFGAAINERSEMREERIELSEEKLEEISNTINLLSKRDLVQIEYYDGRIYRVVNGENVGVNDIRKEIVIEKEEEYITIKFLNIKNIKIL